LYIHRLLASSEEPYPVATAIVAAYGVFNTIAKLKRSEETYVVI
jgi:hypothetical protein